MRHAIANPCSVPHHCTECQYALFGACHAHRNLGHSLAVRSIGIGNARCAVRGWKTTARSPTAPTAAACRRMPPQSFLGTLGGVFAARRRTPSHAAALNFDPDHDHDPLLRLQSFNWTGDPEGPFALFWSAPSPSPVSGCGPPDSFAMCSVATGTPATPSSIADGDQAPETQRRNTAGCRHGSDTRQWAAGEGMGKYLGLTDSTGDAQAGAVYCNLLWCVAIH